MIRNPNDIQDGAKKIRMLIAGYPGIGKSTLALSAPRPLHIDCDFGIDRIEPRYRMPYIQPSSYDEILNDLKPENLKDFETLVFDTAGKLITLMGLWAIKQNPKYGQRDGSLSLKGYGFVGREFVRLMDYCFYELKKNIVVVFHATEEKDGDNTRLRIKVEGQTKNNVWEPMDLGGFVEMYGNDRTIGFSNCEKYFAKGTRGIHGVYKIPALGPGSPNDFLTKLFEEYNSKAAEEVAANAKENEAYEQVMQEGSKIIAGIKDADTANAAMRKSSPPSRWWCSDGLAPRQTCRRFSAAAAARICASSSVRALTGLCRMPRLRVCSPRLCPAAQPRHRLEVARHEVEKTIPQPDRVRFVCDGWLHPRKHGLLPAGGRVGNRAGYLRQPFSELADAGD